MTQKRIDFFIVGAMRSGTSSIRDALAMNPQIDMPKGEGRFFHKDENYLQGFDEYHKLFDWENDYLLRGEKSPQYAVSLDAPLRLQKYNHRARIVWMFRNPVDRAISHYAHALYRNSQALPLYDAIMQRDELERTRSTLAYVLRSEYEKQMTHWLKYFPSDQHCILILEEVIADPEQAITNLHNFLGLSSDNVHFPHSYRPEVTALVENDPSIEKLRPQLAEILAPTVDWMEEHLGRRLLQWRANY